MGKRNIKLQFSLDQLADYRYIFFMFIISLLAIAARIELFKISSRDLEVFLVPWSDYIKEHGILFSMKNGVPGSNYPPLYLLILGLLNFLPLNTVESIKLFSVIFDFACAIFAYLIVREFRKDAVPGIAFAAVLFAPTVILNSARWGQCDSIYTAFILASVYFYLKKDKLFLPGIMFGVALTFKLQAVFFAPAFLFISLKRRENPVVPFFSSIIGFLIANAAPLLLGTPVKNIISVYFSQTGTYQDLVMGRFPNIYDLIPKASEMTTAIIFFAAGIIFMIFYLLWEKLRSDENTYKYMVLAVTMVSLLLVPFVLPRMHERYYFPADVFSIVFGAVFVSYAALPVAVIMLSLLAYFPYLFGPAQFDNSWLGIFMLCVMMLVARGLYKGHFYPKDAGDKVAVGEAEVEESE